MDKKTIKIKFLGTYYQNGAWEKHTLWPILNTYYNVEISENPDFVIATPLDSPFSYMKYDCVRILFTGENFSPDFNVFDYAITCDNIQFEDRFYRFQQFNSDGWALLAAQKHIDIPVDILQRKKYFCDFIYKNSQGQKAREEIFHKLNAYKRVESGGPWLNNMPNGKTIGWPDEKQEFQKLCKFTIAFDSIRYPGFITEKITNAFMNRTIPIYLGAPDVTTIFNPRAFIHCGDYEDLDAVVAAVKYIDEHDDVYMEMLREPAFIDPEFPQKTYDGLVTFVRNIFDQDPKSARRRYEEKFSIKTHADLLRKAAATQKKEQNSFKNRLKRFTRKLIGAKQYEKLKKKVKKNG